jgi:hypothetical protein
MSDAGMKMAMNSRTVGLVAAGAALLAGCASSPGERRPTVRPLPGIVAPARPQQPSAGDLVLGRTASALIAAFGRPALDVREGTARKLQFSGAACVLDAYLYPPAGRGEPVVTHVDARLPDGRDTDRGACAAALRTR